MRINRFLRVALLGAGLCLPTPLFAQVDTFQVRYYGPGAITPFQQGETFPLTAAVCNQVSPTTISTVNPTRIVWDDPANAGRVCIYTIPATGGLPSLPIPGTFEGSITITTAAGTSAESARVPFSRSPGPAAPLGLKFTR
jgi:hypothetical protein